MSDDVNDADDRPVKRRKSSNNTLLIVLAAGGLGAFFCCIPMMIALLLPAVQAAREAARRTQARNNLMQLGLAAHNFHETFSHLPPRDLLPGEQQQSWMTDLLPFLESSPLYDSINQRAAWDDASNQQAIQTVVPTFLNPSNAGGPLDPETGRAVAHFAGNSHVFGQEKPLKFAEFRDGLSNTMLAGSVVNGIRPWADPQNVRDPSAGIGPGPGQFLHGFARSGGAQILMGDGAVRFVSADTPPEVMGGLAKPDDGESPPDF